MTTHEQIMQQWRRVDEEQAKLHDLQAQQDAEQGDELGANWHRLQAEAFRKRTPEAEASADRAWLVLMAAHHLKGGTVPKDGAHRAAEIEQTMDEMRAPCVHVDDGGPFFAKCGKCGETLDHGGDS